MTKRALITGVTHEAAPHFILHCADHKLARQEWLLVDADHGETCRGAFGA